MKNFQNWRNEQNIEKNKDFYVTRDEFLNICQKYFDSNLRGSMKTHHEYMQENLTEAVETSRYSIEVNYRTTTKEALEGFAKICLGYVSAALKNHGYHTKHVFSEKPLRLLISSRNWDDGEWTGVVTWHPDHNCFVISKGFYNKDRKTVSIQSSQKCNANSASDVSKELHNMMNHLKNQPDKTSEKIKLRPVPLKRGPKT
jgi:hypothetical protein